MACFILLGCHHRVSSPYAQLTPEQLTVISDNDLCRIINTHRYIKSENVQQEEIRRGLTDCSPGEVYCRNLGLYIDTQENTTCRFTFTQQQLKKIVEVANSGNIRKYGATSSSLY